jgi:hypothetical protein
MLLPRYRNGYLEKSSSSLRNRGTSGVLFLPYCGFCSLLSELKPFIPPEIFMSEEILHLKETLSNGVTADLLKEISAKIISAFRAKNYEVISRYAERAGIEHGKDSASRTFSLLMHHYHPDKHAKIQLEICSLTEKGDVSALRSLLDSYLFNETSDPEPSYTAAEDDYTYSDDDFGYSEDWSFEEEPSQEEETPEEETADSGEEINFTEAVNRHFYGSLDEAVTLSDMNSLDGELDLSDSFISVLTGAQHCPKLASLNLSGNSICSISALHGMFLLEKLYLSENRIESIIPLAELSSLRELDISFNIVEDISPLLSLEKLEYVNIMGNPVHNRDIAGRLRMKGVIVIE